MKQTILECTASLCMASAILISMISATMFALT